MGPDDLLHSQYPSPPPILVNPDSLQVLDLDFVQRPVGWYFQLDLELMVIDQVRCYDLVDGTCDLDCQIFIDQKRCGFWAFDVGQLCSNDDGREVLCCVVGDAGKQLAVFTVEDPCVNKRWDGQQGTIVKVRSQKWKTMV